LRSARYWIGPHVRDEVQAMTNPADLGVMVLEPNACWALLRSTDVGRLAIAVENRPEILPINYLVDHGTIVFRTAAGAKLAAMVSDGLVAFEADGYDAAAGDAWSVVIKGVAKEIKRPHEIFEAAALPLFPWHAAPKHHFVRVVPEDITGRRFHVVDRSTWDTPLTDAPHSAPE
jgi:hypothetical protein